MKIIGDKIEVLEGERFYQVISGFDYTSASQIVVLFYNRESTINSGFSRSFVKTATGTYPSAGLITLNGAGKMVFTMDTDAMDIGDYDIEVCVYISGVTAPIIKRRTFYLIIKESRS